MPTAAQRQILLGSSPQVVTSGLASEYRFNEGAGATLTDSARGVNGTLQNSPAWSSTGLAFSAASSQYVSVAGTAPSLSAVHVMGVARVDSVASTRTLFSRWGASGSRTWIVQITTGSKLLFGIVANTLQVPTTTVGITTGTWFFFEGYYDGTNAAARLGASGAYTTAADTGTMGIGTCAIGRSDDTGGSQYLEGALAYLLEYTRKLGSDEVTYNYNTLQTIVAKRGITLP